MIKRTLLLPAILLSLSFHQTAFSHEFSRDSAYGRCMHNVIEKLVLTAEQRSQIKAIKEKNKDAKEKFTQELRDIRAKMRPLVNSDTMDEAKLDALINQKKEVIAQIMKTKMMSKHQIYMVLDPSQKTMFHELAAKCDMIH